jgi:hypothetical protein
MVEIFFSVIQKKVVSPNDFPSLEKLSETLLAFIDWGAPRLPDSPSIRMDVWKGEVIASTEEELLSRIPG